MALLEDLRDFSPHRQVYITFIWESRLQVAEAETAERDVGADLCVRPANHPGQIDVANAVSDRELGWSATGRTHRSAPTERCFAVNL